MARNVKYSKMIHVITNLNKVNKVWQNFVTFSDQSHVGGDILTRPHLNTKLHQHPCK